MQIGCHGLVWSGSFDSEGFEHAATKALAAGFDLLEIPLLEPQEFDVEAARRALGDRPIAISASLGQSEETDLLSENQDHVAAGEAKLIRAVDIVAELGGSYLVGVLYSQLRKYLAPATPDARMRSVAVLQRVADHAATLGITIGLEVVNRYETNLFNTARGALVYLDEIDRPNVGIHLDTYHMNIEESDFVSAVHESGDRLVYVHIGESHRGYLGSGTIDFGSFFRALASIGYNGPITFESFSTAVVSPQLSRSLAVWRNLWDDSDDLGAHANTYIRSQLRAVESIALQ